MNILNKFFLVSFALISSNSFASKINDSMSDDADKCLIQIDDENIKEVDKKIIISVKIDVADPKKDFVSKIVHNQYTLNVNGKESKLEISIENNELRYKTSCDVKQEKKIEHDKQVITSFSSFTAAASAIKILPAAVNIKTVEPSYKEGVLTITIEKMKKKETPKIQPKKIDIEIK